ncbi:MAG TPA: periplasmic heavy metal sensor [Alphaproteobacteria bacterium]
MVSGPAATRSDRSRRLTIALVISLGINLLIVGAIAGHLLSGHRYMWQRPGMIQGEVGRGSDRPGDMVIQRMTAALPAEYRPAFEAAIAEHRTQLVEAGRAMRDARMKVRDALVAEPFDPAKLDAAFSELRARSQELQTAVHAAVSAAAAKLPADARQKLAAFNRPSRERGRDR